MQTNHSWGYSQFLHVSPTEVLARAHGKKGGESSLHYHQSKHNAFLVLEGVIELRGDNDTVLARLGPLQSWTVPAGQMHRMCFKTDAILFELYWPRPGGVCALEDIVRLVPGKPPDEKTDE